MKFRALLCAALLLTGCSGLKFNDSYQSVGQDSRVQFIVLHYTSSDLPRSLYLLTGKDVSSHYLIAEQPATIYRLVDENRRAWHAGNSQWNGRTWLNSSSIGIEIFTQQLPSTLWFQQQLAKVGYAVPEHGEFDQATRNVVAAFQMKYRPDLYDGEPDAHTAAMLLALTTQMSRQP